MATCRAWAFPAPIVHFTGFSPLPARVFTLPTLPFPTLHPPYPTLPHPGYSHEITTLLGGWGLEGLLGSRAFVLSGIVNGIDMDE